MSRAKRHYLPGLIWHITHRCHKREFLLKFIKDKRTWTRWMLEAKRKYGLYILNYTITSNHIHLLIQDNVGNPAVAKSLGLAASRVAQAYNKRKNRSGAFWEDRYHSTAIETGVHLVQCLSYIDMNMVRANVVDHPDEWPFCGYYELQRQWVRYRNRVVDLNALLHVLGMKDVQELKEARRAWIEAAFQSGTFERDPKWTESVAVGSKNYVEKIRQRLGGKAKGRNICGDGETYVLHEKSKAYSRVYGGKNTDLSPKRSPAK
jgi:putative transposase